MGNQKPLRVVVAADQAIIRRGLTSLLISIREAELVGEARDLEEAAELCERTGPELVLLDSKAPLAECKKAIQHIHQKFPNLQVIMLVSSQDEQRLLETPDEEICCYFSRDISEEEFTEAIHQLGASRAALTPPDIPKLEEAKVKRRGKPRVGVTTIDRPGPNPERMAQELAMAGKIQASILPEKEPSLPGWEIAARLAAARETSGDFYDFIPVTDKNWGIVIADVADKGMGAALFMTLTSTLLRNYAARYPTLPALTMDAVNTRILSDTHTSMYVTAFFGVLEPHTGRMRYANAGHPPPLFVKNQKNRPLERLSPTGMALGVLENFHWKQKLVTLAPGDVLLLYTDGVLEALNAHGVYFGEQRLQNLLRDQAGKPAKEILEAVLTDVQRFISGFSRQDDVALVVVARNT